MTAADFRYIRMNMVHDVAVVEIRTKEIHGTRPAQEFGAELALVAAQDWARRMLIDFGRVGFLSSSGFAALFQLVGRAKAEGREIKFCAMEPGVRLGAEIVGLDQIAEIHKNEASALRAFART
jgi:anti-sigma B factor antagonist